MPLNVKPDQSRLTTLLTDTVVLLCKNGLNFQSTLRIVGVLGITIDDSDVFIVHLNENVSSTSPDTPDVTSFTDNPKTSGVDGCRGFHSEKRVVPLTPRSGKSSGRSSNKAVNDAQDLRSKGSTEDGRMVKMDRGLRKSEHASEIIQIKEENVEVIEEELTRNNALYGRDEEDDCGTQVSRREKRTFKWTREIGHVSIADATDYVGGSNEMFVDGEERGVETTHGGMDAADEWNLDMLALSNLPGVSSEVDGVPPWPGYVWGGGGGTYPSQQCLTSGEMSRTQSQSMSFEGRSSIGGRGASTDPDPGRGRVFSCEVPGCGRTFLRGSELYRHQRRKHGARHRRSPRGGILHVRGGRGWSTASWNHNLHRN